jgi:hypothetical protein
MAAELALATEVLDVGVGFFGGRLAINPDQPPTHDELWLSLGIVVKASKQYRAVGAMVELGLGDVATSNCRMLIETSLAGLFLMMPEVTLQRGGKPVPDVPGHPLTTAFRTQLYVANDALSLEKTLRMMHEQGSLTGPDAQATLDLAAKFADEMCAPIGPEWKKRLKDSSSFSGVKILDLADSFGRAADYAVFYRPTSPGVHGADARKSMRLEEEQDGRIAFNFQNTGQGSATALKLASHAYLDVLQVASIRYGLGLEQRTSALRQRVQRMKEG